MFVRCHETYLPVRFQSVLCLTHSKDFPTLQIFASRFVSHLFIVLLQVIQNFIWSSDFCDLSLDLPVYQIFVSHPESHLLIIFLPILFRLTYSSDQSVTLKTFCQIFLSPSSCLLKQKFVRRLESCVLIRFSSVIRVSLIHISVNHHAPNLFTRVSSVYQILAHFFSLAYLSQFRQQFLFVIFSSFFVCLP